MKKLEQHPIHKVRWVDINKVEANDYNPNHVATKELELLYISIKKDGYTQPVVTVYDSKRDKYIIVDGFHRYLIMKRYKDIYDSTGGLLPVVVIRGGLKDRIASTVRHNRARGQHHITGMANVILKMAEEGLTPAEIKRELGLTDDEFLKLRYLSGIDRLYGNIKGYSKAWVTYGMLKAEKQGGDSEKVD